MVLSCLSKRMTKSNNTLGELVLPESIHETKFSFSDNLSKWTSVVFPNTTKAENKGRAEIAASVFSGTTWIQKLTIGTSVKSIADMAFNNCTNLKMIDFLKANWRLFLQCRRKYLAYIFIEPILIIIFVYELEIKV